MRHNNQPIGSGVSPIFMAAAPFLLLVSGVFYSESRDIETRGAHVRVVQRTRRP
jgi:hypothetical protein